MGKISDALNKYAKEIGEAQIARLTRPDVNALMRYDRKTGHLLKYNDQTGEVDIPSMEVLRNKGTIQRLLDNKLISPSGILTQKGLQACERLAKLLKVSEPSAPVQNETAPRTPRPRPPEQAATPALESKQAEKAPVENSEEAISPEADMIISDLEAGEREAAENPLTISPAPAAPQPEYDESALDKNLVSLLDPQSYEAEQFKKLRTSILFPISGTAPRSILVTSAVHADGKSFVSSNLAISIAMTVNKHVLLIDCDLRNPVIHRRFGFRNVRGLSEYLNDHTDLGRLLLRTHVEKLSILPGGTKPPNPSEIISSEKMVKLLEEVKNRYNDRLIVIDAPPPAIAAETSFLSRQVDGIIVVAKFGKTSREDIEHLIETVGSDKIIGSVLNQIDTHWARFYGFGKFGSPKKNIYYRS